MLIHGGSIVKSEVADVSSYLHKVCFDIFYYVLLSSRPLAVTVLRIPPILTLALSSFSYHSDRGVWKWEI